MPAAIGILALGGVKRARGMAIRYAGAIVTTALQCSEAPVPRGTRAERRAALPDTAQQFPDADQDCQPGVA